MTEHDRTLLHEAVDWVDEETGVYITAIPFFKGEQVVNWEPEIWLPKAATRVHVPAKALALISAVRTQRRSEAYPTRAEAYLAAYRVVLAHNEQED